jgi:broad specificity phosphatase PhoE
VDHPSYARKFLRLRRPARFYFLRHGESEGNRTNTIQGHQDYPLSDLGRRHARAAGRWLADKDVELLYASPLERARETAEIIARESGAPLPVETTDLMELDTGVFSGLSFEEIEDRYPEAWQLFRVESWESVPGAEPIASLYDRAERHWNRLVDDANEGAGVVVSVTHGGLLQWIVKATLGDSNQRWMPIVKGTNCGIFLLTVRPVNYDTEKPAGLDPADGYFAEWTLVNHLPYGPEEDRTPPHAL